MHGNELRLFWAKEPDKVAVGTIFNVFSYDALLSRDSNLSLPRRRADALRVEQRLQALHSCRKETKAFRNTPSCCKLLYSKIILNFDLNKTFLIPLIMR